MLNEHIFGQIFTTNAVFNALDILYFNSYDIYTMLNALSPHK